MSEHKGDLTLVIQLIEASGGTIRVPKKISDKVRPKGIHAVLHTYNDSDTDETVYEVFDVEEFGAH